MILLHGPELRALCRLARAGDAARVGFPVHRHMARHATGFKLADDGMIPVRSSAPSIETVKTFACKSYNSVVAVEEENPGQTSKGELGLPRHEVKSRGNAGGIESTMREHSRGCALSDRSRGMRDATSISCASLAVSRELASQRTGTR